MTTIIFFILIGYDIRDGLEALIIQAHIYYVVTMCCPGCRSCRTNFFHIAVIAKVGSEDISIELNRDVALSDPNSPVAFVFRLKSEKLCGYCVSGQLFGKSTDMKCPRASWRSLSLARPIWSSSLIWQKINFSGLLPQQALILAGSYLFRNIGHICPPYFSHSPRLFFFLGTRE